MLTWFRRRSLTSFLLFAAVALVIAGAIFRQQRTIDEALTATVRRGTLTARLTVSGSLKPAASITYRSPLSGRETQIAFLVAEGTHVGEGDLLARLDTTDLQRELERARQELRQAQVDFQVAEIERQAGQAAIESLEEGEGALSVDEARTRLQLAERKVARLRRENEMLKPLLEKGFITREELNKTDEALDQAEQDLGLARKKADVLIQLTHPQDRQRAELQLAQKDAQRENVRARLQEAQARVKLLQEQIDNCSLYARQPGLVVYEEYLGANPRRKIRVGDRVTVSQGLVTLPEVNRMLVEASVSEGDLHRVQPGQRATIFLEAFPDLRLTGSVTRVGTLASLSAERAIEDKRFDLIVELDPTDAELRPEMTARADVLLGERSGVLLLPVNAVFQRQGLPVCHVVGPFGIETRAVQLGEPSDLVVEVVSGLREGERVALTDVANSAISAGSAPPVDASKGKPLMKTLSDRSKNALEPR
jgi:HlyD family secretion protein